MFFQEGLQNILGVSEYFLKEIILFVFCDGCYSWWSSNRA